MESNSPLVNKADAIKIELARIQAELNTENNKSQLRGKAKKYAAEPDKFCIECGSLIPKDSPHWLQRKRCENPDCLREALAKRYRQDNIIEGLPSADVERIALMRVSIDLIRRGYEIYQSTSESNPCDLVIALGNSLLRVEVRSAHMSGDTVVAHVPVSHKFDLLAMVTPKEITYDPELPEREIENASSTNQKGDA
jgi:hypothetical protein